MSAGLVWETDAQGGYMYADELSDRLRTAVQPLAKFRQLCEPDEDAINKGLHRGDKYRWNVYGDVTTQGRRLSETQPMPETGFTVSQAELTIYEFGNSVPYTKVLDAFAKHDVLKIIDKALKNDARKAFDIEAYLQFDATPLIAAAATSTTSITLNTNSTTAVDNNVGLGTGHVKAIVDTMRERDIPGYADDDYVAISHPSTLRPFKNELETIHQYTDQGLQKIFAGEVGRYESTRFVEQDFIPKGGAIDAATFDPYTRTAEAWDNGQSSWAFFCGGDTVNEAMVIPEEIRAKLPGDYGRAAGVAWYALTGFGLFHTSSDATQARIVKWDSAS